MYDIFRLKSSKSTPLWSLLLQIKLLELKLRCCLIVTYVPGTTISLQSMDGLSRGVPIQTMVLHRGNDLAALLWRPAPPSYTLLTWVFIVMELVWAPLPSWMIQYNSSNWSQSLMINCFVFWCISPGFVRHAILQALYTWVKNPTTWGHIFLIPQLL